MGLFKNFSGLLLGKDYRDTLEENFGIAEKENEARKTKDNELETKINNVNQTLDSKIDSKEQESIDRDEDLDLRIDNIVSQAGTDNTEIVDARLGVDGTPYNVLKDRLDKMETPLIEQDSTTSTLQHGLNVINSDQSSPLKVEFHGGSLVNLASPEGNDGTSTTKAVTLDSAKYYIFVEYDTNHDFVSYTKISATTSTTLDWTGNVYASLYEVDSTTFNNIGVSLVDVDVARLYPHIQSVQHVKNPVLTVRGENLLPPFTEWNLHANAEVTSPYELTLNATGAYQQSTFDLFALENTNYTIDVGGTGEYYVSAYDSNGSQINIPVAVTNCGNTVSFTTQINTVKLRVIVRNGSTTGTFTFTNPMLNLGTTAKPFVSYNPSYLYALTTLAGLPLSDKKDISWEQDGTWYKEKWFETGVEL